VALGVGFSLLNRPLHGESLLPVLQILLGCISQLIDERVSSRAPVLDGM
jgi:hypothetical protein